MREINHKSLKQERVASYFVQAAKEIILSEGVESVSVRKVADRAGYAFSTIYKHYRDLDALLQDVKSAMIQDVFIYMKDTMPEQVRDLEDIKKVNRAYAAYYIEHPHVFRFFYSYRLNPSASPTVDLPDFSSSWYLTYRAFADNGTIREEDIPVISKTFIYALHGLIALFFAGYGLTAEAVYAELDALADYILRGRRSL